MKKTTLILAISSLLCVFSLKVTSQSVIPLIKGNNLTLQNQFQGKKISLQYKKIKLHQLLQEIASLAGISLTIQPNVANIDVAIEVKQAPWDYVLDLILKNQRLMKVTQGKQLVIAKNIMPLIKKEVVKSKDEHEEQRPFEDRMKEQKKVTSPMLMTEEAVSVDSVSMSEPAAYKPQPQRILGQVRSRTNVNRFNQRQSGLLNKQSANLGSVQGAAIAGDMYSPRFSSRHRGIAYLSSPSQMYSIASSPKPAPAPTLDYIAPSPLDGEKYQETQTSPIKLVSQDPVSTFSIDVDTGSYANVRRMIQNGQLPPSDAVRIEEMVNYFDYDYPNAPSENAPFTSVVEIAPSPWNKEAKLLHIGIKGYQSDAPRPKTNLVFLIDVSGSMYSANKLPLLKSSLKLLTKQLTKDDMISIVVYAGAAGMVLEPTRGDNQHKIITALDKLRSGGSTNGNAGIRLAYQLAEQNKVEDGINRILIATDGDFNVGTSSVKALKALIAEKRKSGISLTTLGFGTGNYNEHLMEQIADVGNGNYAYIDSLKEANKVLVEEMKATLMTIAKDVKIQIEFNPDAVSQYRLIGYENRMLRNQDFNNDKIDAGEIGAGHTVTALYELILKDEGKGWVEPLRYAKNKASKGKTLSNELAHLRIRYKKPNGNKSKLLEFPLYRNEIKSSIEQTSNNYRFSAAVAGFAQLLKDNEYLHDFNYDNVLTLARGAKDKDAFGYRGEFLQLVSLTKALAK